MSTFASEKNEQSKNETIFLKIGASLCLFLAVGHLACLAFLETAFQFYQIQEQMDYVAQHGTYLPYLIDILMVAIMSTFALYGFSAAGVIKKLPYVRSVLAIIIFVMMARTFIGIGRLVYDFNFREIISILLSGSIGLCYLFGTNIRLKYKND